jgi:hypothetical protein
VVKEVVFSSRSLSKVPPTVLKNHDPTRKRNFSNPPESAIPFSDLFHQQIFKVTEFNVNQTKIQIACWIILGESR